LGKGVYERCIAQRLVIKECVELKFDQRRLLFLRDDGKRRMKGAGIGKAYMYWRRAGSEQ